MSGSSSPVWDVYARGLCLLGIPIWFRLDIFRSRGSLEVMPSALCLLKAIPATSILSYV